MFFNWLQQLGNSTEFEDVEFLRFDKYLLQVNDLVESKMDGQPKWPSTLAKKTVCLHFDLFDSFIGNDEFSARSL